GAIKYETNEGNRVLVVGHTRGTCPKRCRTSRRGRKDPLRAAPDGRYPSDVPECSRGRRQSAPTAYRGDLRKECGRGRYIDRLFRPLVLPCPSENRRTLDDL